MAVTNSLIYRHGRSTRSLSPIDAPTVDFYLIGWVHPDNCTHLLRYHRGELDGRGETLLPVCGSASTSRFLSDNAETDDPNRDITCLRCRAIARAYGIFSVDR